jgi:predicted acyltransferase
MRWKFIDQFRGFAIVSMIIVNICNEFSVSPYWLKHHKYGFTFADFVAPAFIFIVGFSYRLSLKKSLETLPITEVRRKFIKRYLIITFLGFLYGFFDFYVSVWDALTDIGIAGLLLYPFVGKPSWVILLSGSIYMVIYQLLFSLTGYGNWIMENSIDGGPLGPLSWAFILAYGAFCAVYFERDKRNLSLSTFSLWLFSGIFLTLFGWFLANPVSNFWSMSLPFTQKGMTASYSLFSSGLCSITLCLFYIINERFKLVIHPFTTMGRNPLVLYFLQAILIFIALYLLPENIHNRYITPYLTSLIILLICYTVAKILEIKSIYIKV